MARRRAVGLDIGTRTITAVEVRLSGGRTTVTRIGQHELPEGSVREGEIVDVDAVAQAVRQVLADAGIKEKKVNLGVANQRVVVRQVNLPNLPANELRSSLPFYAQEHIPIPVEQAELDYHVLDTAVDDEGNETQRVLLVAAQKDMIAAHVSVAERAGLKPIGVDLNPFALLRTLANESLGDTSEVFIDIGAGVTSIVVHQGGVPLFVRILVLGGDDVTASISDAEDLSFTDAEQRKRELGSLGDDPTSRAVNAQVDDFVDEVRSSLDYFRTQSGVGRVERVVLAGGGAVLAGLSERLAQVLGLTVELAAPFDTIAESLDLEQELLEAYGPVLTTSIGLAMGGLE